ncbi:hypothetical protein D3C80_1721180 [compost metagenome]
MNLLAIQGKKTKQTAVGDGQQQIQQAWNKQLAEYISLRTRYCYRSGFFVIGRQAFSQTVAERQNQCKRKSGAQEQGTVARAL